ncbi:SRPBCC family protein [Pedobacter frigoris]|uniref:SRPBCC family protein n=1 Tax=Pedobacter frigoris TaxID=2571272 RepID=UPI00292E3BDC|nr:SRPBCC family protein [Pedobacter frigoris]
MKVVRILAGIIVLLVTLFFIIGLFLPKTYHVSRSIEINKPDSIVYQKTLNLNDLGSWNPWMKMDSAAKFNVTGDGTSTGSKFSWEGKEVGTGAIIMDKLNPYKQIDQKLVFIKPFESIAMTSFYFEPTGSGGTKVTWDFKGENTSIFSRWMSLAYDSMIGKDYDKGLSNLKAFIEKQ